MEFAQPLIPARLLRRYKRFLADVELADGSRLTVHCPNTGAMLGCDHPGARVWLSRSDNPRRRYPHTWEMVETEAGQIVGINTARTNHLIGEALASGIIEELAGFAALRREVRLSQYGARIDFLLEYPGPEPDCYLEVKNVTAAVSDRVALFPDAASVRAVRHLQVLTELVSQGHGAALCYCAQRSDVDQVRPAVEIDPAYADALARARAAGVRVLAYGCRVEPDGIVVERRIGVQADMV